MEVVRHKCGFMNIIEVSVVGSKEGLCLAWKDEISVTLESYSCNLITAMIKKNDEMAEGWLISFFGSPYVSNKKMTWEELRCLDNAVIVPWCICDYFNEILYSFEKVGGLLRDERRMESFRQIVQECDLVDLGYSGPWYTWERGNFTVNNI